LWKEGVLAGIATVGGLFFLTRQPVVKDAETVSFSAPRGFPKKVRIENEASVVKDGLNAIFEVEKGYYFARRPRFDDYNKTIEYRYGNNFPIKLNWEHLRFDNEGGGQGFFFRESLEGNSLLLGHLANLGTPLNGGNPPYGANYIEFTTRKTDAEYDEYKDMVSKMKKTMMSRADFEKRWEKVWGGKQAALDRLPAYWELYEIGTVDNEMNNESVGGIYYGIESFMEEIMNETYAYDMSDEESVFNELVERNAKNILNGSGFLRGWDWYGLGVEENLYTPDLEDMKIMAEFFILRENLLWYQAWEQNIKPLVERGWNPIEGAIVQNIRQTWDAYRDRNETPERYDKYLINFSPRMDNPILFSYPFVVKRSLKRRPFFLKAIAKDAAKCDEALKGGKNRLAIDSSMEIRDGLIQSPPFSKMDYFEQFMRTDYYYDDFFDNLNTTVQRAGNELTDAERNSVKQKAQELIQYKLDKMRDDAKAAQDFAIQSAQENYKKVINDEIPDQKKEMEGEMKDRLVF
jgi:CHASE3 domain sensor protein